MEEYKFVGFSSELDLYAKVENYVNDLIESILTRAIDRESWSFIEYQGDASVDRQEVRKRRFVVSPDTVVVGCHNAKTLKGLRVQIQDPATDGGAELSEELGVSLPERPAIFSAFMDEFGEVDEKRFSRDLVIVCELTKRTETAAGELMRRYIVDELTYEAMAAYAQGASDEQEELWRNWKRVGRTGET